MRKLFLASSSLTLLMGVVAADAADLAPQTYTRAAPVPLYSWTGFYLGLNAGAASLDADLKVLAQTAPGTPFPFERPYNDSFHKLGFIGGGQIGYNWQTGMSVLGVEADAAWSDLKASSDTIFDPFFRGKGVAKARFSTSLDWLVTVRGRAGIAATPALLLYVTGGAAIAGLNIKYEGNFPGAVPVLNTFSVNNTLYGWTAGFGAEFALGGNWSVRGEYLRVQFDNSTLNVPLIAVQNLQGTVRVSPDIDLFRFGVNYKL